MKFSGFKKLYDKMYTDSMAVFRHVEVENEDGTVGIKLQSPGLLSAVPCRISYMNDDSSDRGEQDRNSLHHTMKVFCRPEVDVRKGDEIIVSRTLDEGPSPVVREFKGIANEARIYDTHLEIIFAQKGDA